jgi:hypothetical protein
MSDGRLVAIQWKGREMNRSWPILHYYARIIPDALSKTSVSIDGLRGEHSNANTK